MSDHQRISWERLFAGGRSIEAGQPIPWSIKAFYGLGQAAESVKNWGFGTLLLIYYNQVLGLSGTLASLAIAISLIFDAISDPAVGSWSDGIKSKYGRRHPFLVAAVIPLCLFFYLLFWPPEELGTWALFAWLTFFTIMTRTALTLFHVPYMSLGAELTQNYQERTTIVAVRTAMGLGATLFVIFIAFNFFFVSTEEVPRPQLTREPYFKFAWLSAVVMGVMMVVSAWGTRGSIPSLAGANQEARQFRFTHVYGDLIKALGNVSFRALFVGALMLYIYLGVHGALSIYLQTFYWELDTSAIKYWQMAAALGAIAGIPLVPGVNRLLDKKMTIIWSVIVTAVLSTVPVLLKLVDLMPTDPDILVPLLCTLAALGSTSSIQTAVTAGSMMMDITDEHELIHGKRQEGIYMGAFSFSIKCTSAVGTLFAGLALDIIDFPRNATETMTALPDDVMTRFGLLYAFWALFTAASAYVFWPYALDRQRHAEIMEKLREGSLASGD